MKPSIGKCPVCSQELTIARYHCDNCDTSIEGRFENGFFPGLSQDQVEFVRTFVRCEGKINRMEQELGLSYPTIRNRLRDVIRALGFEPGKEESPDVGEQQRRTVLDDLDSGKLSVEDAMRALHGEEI